MVSSSGTIPFAVACMLLAVAAAFDLHRVEQSAVTVYTTPALRDFIEQGLAPRWAQHSPLRIEPLYVAAGEQYNRLRMSGAQPEADLFLHASPLYLEKGLDEEYMVAISPERAAELNDTFHGALGEHGGTAWYAFAWTPLVEVYAPELGAAPDLAHATVDYGLPHPTLSNNGVYVAVFLETVSPPAGRHARDHTVVQPVNARTNILGIADGSFDVTLGFESVARFFEDQGARIAYDTPLVEGRRVSTPVLFSVALVDGPHPEEARRLVEFLFSPETQRSLATYHLRPVLGDEGEPLAPGADTEFVAIDWADWHAIEEILPLYEVRPTG